MATSFVSPSRHAQYNIPSQPQSTSPPTLTNTSSPTSSDSTGDDEASANVQARAGAFDPRAADLAAADAAVVVSTATNAAINTFSPSIWREHSHSLIPGLDVNDVEPHQQAKFGLDSMNFGSWDGNFANLGVQNDADLSVDMDSTSSTDHGFSPGSVQSPTFLHNAMPTFSGATQSMTQDSPDGSDSKTGSVSLEPAGSSVGIASLAGSGEDSDGPMAWAGKISDNDEAMFDSFVQSGSFDVPSIKAEPGAPHGSGSNGHSFAAMNIPTSSSATMTPSSAPIKATASRPTKPSNKANSSANPSRRNSGESSEPRKLPGTSTAASRRLGSQTAVHSNNLDADLGYSAFEVIRPSREGLKDLQVHIHGVPMHGAKSRVETQIRMRIELVRPKSAPAGGWERIGSFTHIKLPPLSGTKRKSKKYQKSDVPPEKTLFVDATVVNATPPHDRVFVCKGCRQRERKRAHRKKDPKTPLESQPTDEEMKSLGVDPSAPDAVEKTQARMEEEEKKRVVLFNCGDFVDFEEGEAVLPTRITCYCRHHKEKVGFCVIFTMRDWQGRLIATGSTPPIMITDDHKSMGIAAQAAQAAAAGAASNASSPSVSASLGVIKQVNGTSPRNPPLQQSQYPEDQADAALSTSGSATPSVSANTEAPVKQKKERSKPYDGNRRRRNTSGKDLNMTPYSGTGQNTPSLPATSPTAVGNGVDFSSSDFWNAFANAGPAMNGLGRSNSTSTGAKTPGDASSVGGSPTSAGLTGNWPTQSMHSSALPQQALQLPQIPPQMQAQLAQGSLSPTTLQTNLASLPSLDLEQFFRNAQAGVSSGVDFAQLMAMAAAAALPPHLRPNSNHTAAPSSASGQASPPGQNHSMEQAPVPRISKLIPGEGPTSGGIEVTVLGENFTEGTTCVFGDTPAANTKVWASNTLVCLLPPSSSPGPVVVSVKGPTQAAQPPSVNGPLQLFTYIDTTDRALMELALQVVGLQMTGQMRSAREVAMRVVGSGGGQQASMPAAFNGGAGGGVNHTQAREAVAGLFTSRSQSSSFQDSVVQFLLLLDADVSTAESAHPTIDAIRLANNQGHTLLHLATLMGFHRLVEVLIRRGCPLDARDHNGATALHFAAIQGRVTITRMLLRAGARDDVADINGLYAIDLARNHDQVDVETILDNTSRTGHWQTRRLSSHATSSLCYDEDEEDLVSDDLSSEASPSDVDEDNVSTSFDEYSDDSFSVSGGEAEDAPRAVTSDLADDIEARQALSELPAPIIDEKACLKTADERLGEDATKVPVGKQDASEADEDAASKSWLSKAGDTGADWMNRAFLPQTMAHKFSQLHMPTMPAMPAMPAMSAINVFHLGLQTPTFMPWSGAQRGESADTPGETSKEAGDAKGKTRSSAAVVEQGWEQDERGRLFTLWRNIVEEGALSLIPLYSPPPAYESVAAAESQSAASSASREPTSSTATNRAMSTPEANTPIAGPSRRSSMRRRSAHASNEAPATASTPASAHTARVVASASSISKSKANLTHGSTSAVARRRKNQLNLRDDAMLVWFWIPVLLIALVVVLFSKSSSIFSYADLMSYLDLPAVGRK